MTKFQSKEEYEAWKANKLGNKQTDQIDLERLAKEEETKKIEQERLAKEEEERKKIELKRLAMLEEERKEAEKRLAKEEELQKIKAVASSKLLDKEQKIPDPIMSRLSMTFYVFAALSILVGFLSATEPAPLSPIVWIFIGIINAAFFAFLGKSLDYLKGIYINTFRS